MSWDLTLYKCAAPPPEADRMPEGWEGEPIAAPQEVAAMMNSGLPGIVWTAAAGNGFDGAMVGVLEDGNLYLEIYIGPDDPCTYVEVSVRGDGDPVPAIERISVRYGWYVFDEAEQEWWHHLGDQAGGWARFRALRRRLGGE